MRIWIDRAAIGLGGLALAAAVTLVFAPDAVAPLFDPSALDRGLSGVFGLIAIGGAILIGGAIGVWKGAVSPSRTEDTLLVVNEESARSTARGFDETLETAIQTGDRAQQTEVRETLRDVAVETIAAAEKRPASAVREDVLAGEWVDDPVVAAFLGDASAADPPLKWRLYAWLHDDRAFEKSVERSLEAIETYGDRGESG